MQAGPAVAGVQAPPGHQGVRPLHELSAEELCLLGSKLLLSQDALIAKLGELPKLVCNVDRRRRGR